ncbi:Disease resistance protein [Corchorus olitorius]|uniref:Disease resistance protein n=1 Tax=Corchorus olitorius TaxID=93759 RepID=A0A1R3H8E0_9ROSI|nr:Disease resistance protein [Corchorus olitorius]
MAESLVSFVLEQLVSLGANEVAQRVKLFKGVDAEVEKLTSNLQAIQAVLQDAERRQETEATVKLWLEKLKDVSYDIDDVLDEWNTSILKLQNSEDAEKVCSFRNLSYNFCFHQVGLRHDIAVKIKELNERLADIANERNAYNFISGTGRGSQAPKLFTTSVIDVPEPLKNSILKSASPESRILITTRKRKVATVMGSGRTDMCHVGILSNEDCWKLLRHLAFSERSNGECAILEDVGRKIVERCKGLPLAVKTLGSLLRFKKTKEEWQSILDSEMWEIKEVEESVFVPLLVDGWEKTREVNIPLKIIRHSMLMIGANVAFPIPMNKLEKIRSILPHGIGKLKNLRHLENEGTEKVMFMPVGLMRLTALRTLKEFTVGSDEKSSCKLGDLGKLKHLQGSLMIRGLNNVKEASEVREGLSTIVSLRVLRLLWFVDGSFKRVRDGEKEDVVVEALQPPPSLQCLEILHSKGSTSLFPSWMASSTMLKRVKLYNCYNWESLPPLGKLPSLESLHIEDLGTVNKVGQEFLGIERQGENGESLATNIIAFPNLQELELSHMHDLEDWEYENLFSESSGGITIMPRLHSLHIKDCPNLKALPHHLFHHLQQLRITACPILDQRFQRGKGGDWHYISHIPKRTVR